MNMGDLEALGTGVDKKTINRQQRQWAQVLKHQ